MIKLVSKNDFLVHTRKTVHSFGLVSEDISSINAGIEKINIELGELKKSVFKHASDIAEYRANNLSLLSKIENINTSIENAITGVSSFKNDISAQNSILKILTPRSKSHSLKIRQLNSALKKSQEEIKKLRNFINRKLRTVKRADLELELKIKSQRRHIIKLNKKIENSNRIRIKSVKKKIKINKVPIKKTLISTKKTVGFDKMVKTSTKETIEPNKKTIIKVKEEEIKK